jgi:hypothetical protein
VRGRGPVVLGRRLYAAIALLFIEILCQPREGRVSSLLLSQLVQSGGVSRRVDAIFMFGFSRVIRSGFCISVVAHLGLLLGLFFVGAAGGREQRPRNHEAERLSGPGPPSRTPQRNAGNLMTRAVAPCRRRFCRGTSPTRSSRKSGWIRRSEPLQFCGV